MSNSIKISSDSLACSWKKSFESAHDVHAAKVLFALSGKLVRPLEALFRTVQTDTPRNFAASFFLPICVHVASKVQKFTARVFIDFPLCFLLDVLTLPIRVITLLPSMRHNAAQQERQKPLEAHLRSLAMPEGLRKADDLNVKFCWEWKPRNEDGQFMLSSPDNEQHIKRMPFTFLDQIQTKVAYPSYINLGVLRQGSPQVQALQMVMQMLDRGCGYAREDDSQRADRITKIPDFLTQIESHEFLRHVARTRYAAQPNLAQILHTLDLSLKNDLWLQIMHTAVEDFQTAVRDNDVPAIIRREDGLRSALDVINQAGRLQVYKFPEEAGIE